MANFSLLAQKNPEISTPSIFIRHKENNLLTFMLFPISNVIRVLVDDNNTVWTLAFIESICRVYLTMPWPSINLDFSKKS